MTALWRLHIRPKGGEHGNGDATASVAFCLEGSIIGMGWAVPDETVTRSGDLKWFKEAATRTYKQNLLGIPFGRLLSNRRLETWFGFGTPKDASTSPSYWDRGNTHMRTRQLSLLTL